MQYTLIHFADSVAQFIYILRKMAGEQDGLALRFQGKQKIADAANTVFIKSIHRLVQNHEGRIVQKGLCNAKALSHTEAVLADRFSEGWIKSNLFDQLPYSILGRTLTKPCQP